MIKVTINSGEIETTGEVEVGDVYPGLCCTGHDWTVSLVQLNVWGNCSNPDCMAGVEDDSDNYQYKGVSCYDVEIFALKLAEGQEAANWLCSRCGKQSPGGFFYIGDEQLCGECAYTAA